MMRSELSRVSGVPIRHIYSSVAAILLFLALLTIAAPAQAAPKFAAIAVDARSGKILFSKSADAARYPASLTKIMTLYLVFEDLKAGKINLNTRVPFSKYAASRQPSKLGVKAGGSITVEQAILALVTKSANDAATAIAEKLGGTESAFARRMTSTARRIGMTRTTFRNASGLPDAAQKTTARDMATLGLRIQRDHPEYYKYFKTRRFTFGKARFGNHNRLLGRVSGVDGIKTGYTRASGFNLTTSARRDKKRIVAVVMGGRSGKSRNAYMTRLVNRMFKTKKLTSGTHIAQVAGTPPGYDSTESAAKLALAPKPRQKPLSIVKPEQEEKASQLAKLALQESLPAESTDGPDAEPLSIDVLSRLAAETPEKPEPAFKKDQSRIGIEADAVQTEPSAAISAALKQTSVTEIIKRENQDHVPERAVDPRSPQPVAALSVSVPEGSAPASQPEEPAAEPDWKSAPIENISEHGESWNIQVGAFPTKDGALNRLDTARSKVQKTLQGKSGYIMEVQKGSSTLHRARFSGFTKTAARRACRILSKQGVACLALPPQG